MGQPDHEYGVSLGGRCRDDDSMIRRNGSPGLVTVAGVKWRQCSSDNLFYNSQTMNRRNHNFHPIPLQGLFQRMRIGGMFAAFVVLAMCLVAAVVGGVYSLQETQRTGRLRFEFRVKNATDDIHQHMQAYAQALKGGIGLFLAAQDVTREQWQAYVGALDIQENYPGIQGIGFTVLVPPDEIEAFTGNIRSQGFPSFSIQPDHPRSVYTAIIYLEPFKDRNLRAFGYDMFTDPVRNAAMSRSRDSGTAALSGKVTLVQETSHDVQAGCLLYVPLYWPGLPADTPQQRTEALRGWVYAPFRMNDLMRCILKSSYSDLRIEIFDGSIPDESQLMFDSAPNENAASPSDYVSTASLDIYGTPWTMRASALPMFGATVDRMSPVLAFSGGLIISLLVFSVAISLVLTRARAIDLATMMTSAFKESEEKLQAVFDSVWDGIITLDENACITSVNPAACRIFGYGKDDMLGKSITALSPESRPELNEPGGAAELGKTVDGVFEMKGLRANGDEFPMDVAIGGMRHGGKRLTTLIIRDISERKRLDSLKNEFVSIVSHELRTPLTSIRGALGLILGGVAGVVTQKARELLEVAVQNVERLTLLINGILDMEKIDSGRMELRIAQVDVPALLRKAASVNEQFARQHQTVFVLKEPLPAVSIQIDEDRVMQVLTNLLSNAAKFSPPGSQVEIHSEVVMGMLRISVRDHGPGIPPSFRGSVFEKFSQADSSDSRQKDGSGLGLSIAKAIVDMHEGRIWFETVMGEGTVFHLEIPLESGATQREEMPPA